MQCWTTNHELMDSLPQAGLAAGTSKHVMEKKKKVKPGVASICHPHYLHTIPLGEIINIIFNTRILPVITSCLAGGGQAACLKFPFFTSDDCS